MVGGTGLGVGVGALVGVGRAGLEVAVANAGVGVGTVATGGPVLWRPINAPAPTLSTKVTASNSPYWIQRVLVNAALPRTERSRVEPYTAHQEPINREPTLTPHKAA